MFLSILRGLGVDGHNFCSALQFKTWYERLIWYVEEVVGQEEALDS